MSSSIVNIPDISTDLFKVVISQHKQTLLQRKSFQEVEKEELDYLHQYKPLPKLEARSLLSKTEEELDDSSKQDILNTNDIFNDILSSVNHVQEDMQEDLDTQAEVEELRDSTTGIQHVASAFDSSVSSQTRGTAETVTEISAESIEELITEPMEEPIEEPVSINSDNESDIFDDEMDEFEDESDVFEEEPVNSDNSNEEYNTKSEEFFDDQEVFEDDPEDVFDDEDVYEELEEETDPEPEQPVFDDEFEDEFDDELEDETSVQSATNSTVTSPQTKTVFDGPAVGYDKPATAEPKSKPVEPIKQIQPTVTNSQPVKPTKSVQPTKPVSKPQPVKPELSQPKTQLNIPKPPKPITQSHAKVNDRLKADYINNPQVIPRDVPTFVRRYRGIKYSDAKNYISARELDKALRQGEVLLKHNRLW